LTAPGASSACLNLLDFTILTYITVADYVKVKGKVIAVQAVEALKVARG
jgi:hypothetical protein